MTDQKEKFKKEFIKRLIKFSVDVLDLSKELKKDRNLWPVTDQLVRSSTSVGVNVVEAKSSHSKKDYIKFFEIALKSANETKYWFLVLIESNSFDKSKLERLLNEVTEIANILASSILTMKGRK